MIYATLRFPGAAMPLHTVHNRSERGSRMEKIKAEERAVQNGKP